jgi:hypothetical protein
MNQDFIKISLYIFIKKYYIKKTQTGIIYTGITMMA